MGNDAERRLVPHVDPAQHVIGVPHDQRHHQNQNQRRRHAKYIGADGRELGARLDPLLFLLRGHCRSLRALFDLLAHELAPVHLLIQADRHGQSKNRQDMLRTASGENITPRPNAVSLAQPPAILSYACAANAVQSSTRAQEWLLQFARRCASPDSAKSSAPEKSSQSRAPAHAATPSRPVQQDSSPLLYSAPISPHLCRGGACSSLFAPAQQNFSANRAPAGNNPINASDNIVFPLPDSPTNPTHSPAPISSDTPFTGRTHPAAVGNSTVIPRMLSSSLTFPS